MLTFSEATALGLLSTVQQHLFGDNFLYCFSAKCVGSDQQQLWDKKTLEAPGSMPQASGQHTRDYPCSQAQGQNAKPTWYRGRLRLLSQDPRGVEEVDHRLLHLQRANKQDQKPKTQKSDALEREHRKTRASSDAPFRYARCVACMLTKALVDSPEADGVRSAVKNSGCRAFHWPKSSAAVPVKPITFSGSRPAIFAAPGVTTCCHLLLDGMGMAAPCSTTIASYVELKDQQE